VISLIGASFKYNYFYKKAILDLNIAMSKKFKKILFTFASVFIGSAVIQYIINNTSNSAYNVGKLTYSGNLESI